MNGSRSTPVGTAAPLVALVGQPNVGKSVVFHALTGRRVAAANYPGTTIEVTQARARFGGYRVVDTPGVVVLPSKAPDEQATVRALLDPSLVSLVQVGDAKQLRRTLALTLAVAESGLPMVLALNMDDEVRRLGLAIDHVGLASELGMPVVATTATSGDGIDRLAAAVESPGRWRGSIAYPDVIERAVEELAGSVPDGPLSSRWTALQLLAGDPVVEAWVVERGDPDGWSNVRSLRDRIEARLGLPPSAAIQAARAEAAARLADAVTSRAPGPEHGPGHRMGRIVAHPVWGLPSLAVVLAGLYWLVGVFGAGTLVDALENRLFGEVLNPAIVGMVGSLVPFEPLRDLLVGDYGLWTMGMTYALALILPIVTVFFLAFGVLEDSGYLPRLSVLTNRAFRAMGLNGKAVVPMVLGLGCVTMATLTTRTLESRRERLLVILLLALAVPCSAQLGVVMGLLAGVSGGAVLIWGGVVLGVLLAVGAVTARLLPGTRSVLVAELPPMRRPVLANVAAKTAARLEWYLREVVPLFLLGSFVLFVLDAAGALTWMIAAMEPVVTGWLGLPAATAVAFVMGFLRRDFGAAGLFALAAAGALTAPQTVVAMVTMTLFVPCIASVLMIVREQGARVAAAVVAFVFPFAFVVGGVLARVLEVAGWPG